MRRIGKAFLAAICVISLSTAAFQSRATTMIYRSVDELFEMSDTVVRGTIVDHITYWSEEGTLFTDWTVHIDEVLTGEHRTVLTLRQMGGELPDRMMHIAGDARLREGEQLVFFLVVEDGIFYLTAMGQAVMTVSLQGDIGVPADVTPWTDTINLSPVDATLVRDLSDITFYAVDENGSRLYHIDEMEVMTLETLRDMGSQSEQGGVR